MTRIPDEKSESVDKSVALSMERSVDIYNPDDIRGLLAFGGITRTVVFGIGVLVSALSIYEAIWGNFPPSVQRPLHVFLMITLTFMLYGSGVSRAGRLETALNLGLIALAAASTLWAGLNWTPLYIDPYPDTFGLVMGCIAIAVVLEATRRAVGGAMVVLALIALAYAFVGPYLPRAIAHPGFSLENVVVHTVVGTEGMMGLLLSISVNQIIFFMMFAAFLQVSNATPLFMNLASAIAGGYSGGPAKVAVVASGFMGMISGSASGNTATTGAVTIPLMIKMGFKRHIAAAVEAVSSTAGQFMPPIMGASAFVIAEYTGVGYWSVCLAATIPALAYFIGMYVVVDIESRTEGLVGLPRSRLPDLRESFLKTLPLLIPMTVLVVLLANRYSPQWAILNSLAVLVIVCIPIKTQRMALGKLLNGLALTAKILIPIATSCATAGIIVGIMSLTGLGDRLSYLIVSVAQGDLLIGLIFTMFMSIIIGMGLPTLGAYVVLATLGAPALNALGAPLLGAHLFIFYFAAISAITPPVALSAYVAAGIAGTSPMRVGVHAMRLGAIKYLIPYMFVFRPGILLNGSVEEILLDIASLALVILPVQVLVQRFWMRPLSWLEMAMFAGSLALVLPDSLTMMVAALALQVSAIMVHISRHRRAERPGLTST
ncbi:MAG: ATP-binding protein [marine bacterium B5-7]|nr:MAG: ATP-binding protein [marine bacterium B5-7]